MLLAGDPHVILPYRQREKIVRGWLKMHSCVPGLYGLRTGDWHPATWGPPRSPSPRTRTTVRTISHVKALCVRLHTRFPGRLAAPREVASSNPTVTTGPGRGQVHPTTEAGCASRRQPLFQAPWAQPRTGTGPAFSAVCPSDGRWRRWRKDCAPLPPVVHNSACRQHV